MQNSSLKYAHRSKLDDVAVVVVREITIIKKKMTKQQYDKIFILV